MSAQVKNKHAIPTKQAEPIGASTKNQTQKLIVGGSSKIGTKQATPVRDGASFQRL